MPGGCIVPGFRSRALEVLDLLSLDGCVVTARPRDERALIMARAVREQLEQCVTEMRAIVGRPCNGDGDDSRVDAHSLMSIRALIHSDCSEHEIVPHPSRT